MIVFMLRVLDGSLRVGCVGLSWPRGAESHPCLILRVKVLRMARFWVRFWFLDIVACALRSPLAWFRVVSLGGVALGLRWGEPRGWPASPLEGGDNGTCALGLLVVLVLGLTHGCPLCFFRVRLRELVAFGVGGGPWVIHRPGGGNGSAQGVW